MALLAGTAYDPSTAASTASAASLLAMTAMDTTNLRLTFTAPANGTVLVRMRGVVHGGTTTPMTLWGVLDGATVKARMAPTRIKHATAASALAVHESVFCVTGLTPGQSLTWDAAYGVEVVTASAAIKWGGPDNATGNDAFGAFCFEVWEAGNLLAATVYDPAVAVSKSTATLQAMTAFDTTNLRLTFNAPASGKVLVRMQTMNTGTTGTPQQVLLGVLEGATVKGRMGGGSWSQQSGAGLATDHQLQVAEFLVTGLTPSQSLTWDAAYSVETVLAASNIKYGGPNNATGDDAWGGFLYEVWAAA